MHLKEENVMERKSLKKSMVVYFFTKGGVLLRDIIKTIDFDSGRVRLYGYAVSIGMDELYTHENRSIPREGDEVFNIGWDGKWVVSHYKEGSPSCLVRRESYAKNESISVPVEDVIRSRDLFPVWNAENGEEPRLFDEDVAKPKHLFSLTDDPTKTKTKVVDKPAYHLWKVMARMNPRGLKLGTQRSELIVTEGRSIADAAAIAGRVLGDKEYDEITLVYKKEVHR